MISVIFRKLTMDRVKAEGGSEERAMREAATDTAAALGFISAIGAIGGFYSESVWFIFSINRFSSRRDESLSYFSISPASLLHGRYMDVILKIKVTFDYPLRGVRPRFLSVFSYNILIIKKRDAAGLTTHIFIGHPWGYPLNTHLLKI